MVYTEGATVVDVIASHFDLVGYDIDFYPNLLNLLNDGAVYDVSGLGGGTGDMSNVFHWRKTLGLGETLGGSLTKVVTLGTPPPPGPVIPEPGTWALMLSGLAPVALRLRKKA